MEVHVRPELAVDADAIRGINDAAFEGPDEGLIVDRIRGTPDWIEGGSLVAVDGSGRLVGHLLLSLGCLVAADDHERPIWMLGPVGVLPEVQRRGVGKALMLAAIELARVRHEPLICLLGHASHYPQFGFEPARPLGIDPPSDWPDDAWQVLRLPGWTAEMRGVARYAAPFGV